MACATVAFEDQGMPTETSSPEFNGFEGQQQFCIEPIINSDDCGLAGIRKDSWERRSGRAPGT